MYLMVTVFMVVCLVLLNVLRNESRSFDCYCFGFVWFGCDPIKQSLIKVDSFENRRFAFSDFS